MRIRAWLGVVGAMALLVCGAGVGAPRAQAATVLYQPGMSLVARPAGTVFAAADGDLLTLDPATQQYMTHLANEPVAAGVGYFATFSGLTNVRLGADTGAAATVQAPAGGWLLVGNPSANNDASITGADVVYGFDAQEGYVQESTLPPGQGALVYSAKGGAITIRPLPNGIDAQLGDGEDRLIDAALLVAALPAGWTTTAITTNYGNNANVPAQYIEQFRPAHAPKPGDDLQTSFVNVNLQLCKDVDFAATLLAGSGERTARDLYGDTVVDVQQLDTPPDLGDGASLYYVTTQDPNNGNQTGHNVLYLQRGAIFVTMQSNEPVGRHEQDFVLTLARQQDQQLLASYPE